MAHHATCYIEIMPQIIIGIPGPWPDRSAITRAVTSQSSGWLYAGVVLMNMSTRKSFALDVQAQDPNMEEAFRIAGGGRIPENELAAIGAHRHTLYVVSKDVSPATARDVLDVGVALLNCGGLGVKIESSGVAHSAAQWRELAASEDPFDLYTAFVTLVGNRDGYYSCGMHNFGLPDCKIGNGLPPEEAAPLMNNFNFYQVSELPQLESGHTFSLESGSPVYRVTLEEETNYEADHPFHNPFGIWHLETID